MRTIALEPRGWFKEWRIRQKGKQQGKLYPVYFHEDGRTFDSRLKAIAAGCLDPEEDGRKRRKKKQDDTEGEPTRKRSAGEPRAKRKAKAKAKRREPDEDPEDLDSEPNFGEDRSEEC